MVLPQYYGAVAPILKCQAYRQGKYIFKYVYNGFISQVISKL